MKIATFNTHRAKQGKAKIEAELVKLDADILVLTEAVDEFELRDYPVIYKTILLPVNREYEGIPYGTLVKGKTPVRVLLYSKYESLRTFKVTDPNTGLCYELNTVAGPLAM